jgi:hypothetical protein
MSFTICISDTAFNAFYKLSYYFPIFFLAYDVNLLKPNGNYMYQHL